MANTSSVKDAMGDVVQLKPGPFIGSVQALGNIPIVLDRRSLDRFYRECNAIINTNTHIVFKDRS